MMRSILLVILHLSLASPIVNAQSQQERINESRQAIKSFGSQLKAKLMEGMEQGGPIAAIQVCNTAAGDIAKDISEKYGWKISRTSLKLRNVNNTPDQWEQKILSGFERRKQDGEDASRIDHAETVTQNGKPVFRYMKAIPTAGLCLSCHGENIAPEVISKLDQLYPNDEARGFKIGDIRGAFSIVREVE